MVKSCILYYTYANIYDILVSRLASSSSIGGAVSPWKVFGTGCLI